jgi:Spy/CpxP family protein refolding chaperone
MKSGFEALGRMRLQAILLLAAVFVIGILGGVAAERALQKNNPPRRPGPPNLPHNQLPPELTQELHLTPDQEERIRGIFEQYRPRTDAVLDEFFPKLRAVMDSARAEIRTVLSPEQQETFDRMKPPELDRDGPLHFPGGPPPGPPPFGYRPPDRPGGPR